jgi:hypothetical protein
MTEQQEKACREAFVAKYGERGDRLNIAAWDIALSSFSEGYVAGLSIAPPSVEALGKKTARDYEITILALRDDIASLRTTNAAQAERIAELEAGLHKIYEIDDTGPMVFETENGRSYPAGLSKGKSAQIAKTLVVAKPQAGEKHD